MATRFYVMPIVREGNVRGPKYFRWPRNGNPTGLAVRWNMIDYGLIDQCIAVADVTTAQNTTLAANSDVLAIPANLNSTLTATAVSTASTRMTCKRHWRAAR